MNGLWLGAAGAEDIVRPRRLIGASGRVRRWRVVRHFLQFLSRKYAIRSKPCVFTVWWASDCNKRNKEAKERESRAHSRDR